MNKNSYSFLEENAPSVLNELKVRLPSFSARFTWQGQVLGDEDIRVDAIGRLTALAVSVELNDLATQKALDKMTKSQRFLFLSQLFTTISGASIFGVIAAKSPDITKVIVGSVALLGGIASLYSQFLGQGFGRRIEDVYKALTSISYKTIRCRTKMIAILQKKEIRGESKEVLKRELLNADHICTEISELASSIGLPPIGAKYLQVGLP